MQLVRGLHNLSSLPQGCVATIGNFDGIHRGHQAILARLHERAVELNAPSCVVIFEPQPREYFSPESAPVRLTRLREKLELLAQAGVDRVLCLTFNRRLRELSAQAFIDQVLIQGLKVKHLEIGDDFRFGCDRAGDFEALVRSGQSNGFTVEAAATVELDGFRISSTRVREALAVGDLVLAERMLGRPYSLSGRVLHGQKLARQLGCPTANVQLKRRLPPLRGVYLVKVDVEGCLHTGIANIGLRPTVKGDGRPHLEVHLLDFAGDLYGRHLIVSFHRKLRDEQRFASLEALKAAIDADVAAARAYWLGQPLDEI
ncbi:riboflavin kinase/FMN adenylyltransferase [Pseudomonas duriflava]|uniref:Riboflavin biosynthesis protein n=1 Tax=Pseudomonas duriflava TaxID=459528 RepID=A0A562QC52_9PSED|nr:bifunctional riboflavin kinase/FAD synthetase [Pseudomonas duriflava]TWI54322.1 riboflavin kinase/FMN adenylyltransferase [Pseudomonas duriflava]